MMVRRMPFSLVFGALVLSTSWVACGGSGDPGCQPSAELCNGKDDDCDGQIDEGFDVGAACTVGVGACARAGVKICSASGATTECTAVAGAPVAETCNQADDDCDGATDNGLPGCCIPATVRACGVDVGACQAGTETCDGSGAWGACLRDGVTVTLPGSVTETCNGIDDDCDGITDNGLTPPPCALQAGVCAGSTMVCGAASGWLACTPDRYGPYFEVVEASCDGRDNDCDGQTDEAGTAGCTTYYADVDRDGFGNSSDSQCLCTASGKYTATVGGDCNDANGNIHPGAGETCDGLDNDCNTVVDDGFDVGAACSVGTGACARTGVKVCAGGGATTVCNAVAGPPSAETCNGIDDDCNGVTDEGLTPPLCANQMGVCAGSTMVCGAASGWLACTPDRYGPYYQPVEASCDGRDNDCDGQTDEPGTAGCTTYYADVDRDGFGNSGASQCLCAPSGSYTATVGGDCNDADAAFNPGAVELCDGMDNNCNGMTDEGFNVGTACSVGTGACARTGAMVCRWDRTGTVCGAVAGAPTAETCNGVDDDCDGTTDNGLVGMLCPNQAGVCAGSRLICGGASGWLACGPISYGPNYQAVEDRCDGLDNDCDGVTDEGCP